MCFQGETKIDQDPRNVRQVPNNATYGLWPRANESRNSKNLIGLRRIRIVKKINHFADGVFGKVYSAGATTFLSKPLDAIDVQNLISAFEHFWLLQHTQRLKNDSTMSRADLSLSEARQR